MLCSEMHPFLHSLQVSVLGMLLYIIYVLLDTYIIAYASSIPALAELERSTAQQCSTSVSPCTPTITEVPLDSQKTPPAPVRNTAESLRMM